MREDIDVPGTEDETAAELKRMPPVAMLAVSRALGSGFSPEIVAAKDVKQGSDSQFCRAIGGFLFINQQEESNTGILAELQSVIGITSPTAARPAPADRKLSSQSRNCATCSRQKIHP